MSINWKTTCPKMREAFFAYKKHCKDTGKPGVKSASSFAAGWNAAVWSKAVK